MRYLLFLALILFVFFAGTQAPPLTINAQQDSGPLCFQLNADGTWLYIPCVQPTDTPFPTWTPTATNTPAPSTTPTPMATSTPDVEPTATQEDVRTPSPTPLPTVPTVTPTPPPTDTPVPTPDPGGLLCEGSTLVNLRYRDNPALTATTLGVWDSDSRLRVLDTALVDDGEFLNEWALLTNGIQTGWSAAWYRGNEYFRFDVNGDCLQVRFDEPVIGMHVTHATAAIYDWMRDINRLGRRSGVKSYADRTVCILALEQGNVCMLRYPPDDPDRIGGPDPEQSAVQYMEARAGVVLSMQQYIPTGRFYLELTNESEYFDVAWWARWLRAAVRYAADHNYPPLAIIGWGPGYGDTVALTAWQQALEANHAQGGVLSAHNYAPIADCGGDGSLSRCDPWCACRHRTNLSIIAGLGYTVGYAITEASPTDGYQPITGAALRDIGRWVCMIEDDESLVMVFLWNWGDFAPFADANLAPHADALAQSIATCGAG